MLIDLLSSLRSEPKLATVIDMRMWKWQHCSGQWPFRSCVKNNEGVTVQRCERHREMIDNISV